MQNRLGVLSCNIPKGENMDRWYRHLLPLPSRISDIGVSTYLSILFCLFTLAIQVIIPVANIWHIAVAHTPSATFAAERQHDQLKTFRPHLASHRDDEFDNPIYCFVCQSFVHIRDIVDIQVQVTISIARSIDQLFLNRLIVCQIFLHSSTSRAPPLLS
jgi:hypothetical protein